MCVNSLIYHGWFTTHQKKDTLWLDVTRLSNEGCQVSRALFDEMSQLSYSYVFNLAPISEPTLFYRTGTRFLWNKNTSCIPLFVGSFLPNFIGRFSQKERNNVVFVFQLRPNGLHGRTTNHGLCLFPVPPEKGCTGHFKRWDHRVECWH